MNLQQIITATLQIGIVSFRQGKTVEEAQKIALNKHWRDYGDVTGSKEAANRAIANYYATTSKPPPPAPVVVVERQVEVVQAPDRHVRDTVLQIVGNPGDWTIPQLIDFAKSNGIIVRKSWGKAKIVKALNDATQASQAA